MAIEKSIKEGEQCLKDKDYLAAISKFSSAIRESPLAFQAFLQRAIAYQKMNNLEDSKKDLSKAFTIAEERGRRSDIGLCYFRLGLIYYLEKKMRLASTHFTKAVTFDCKEPTLEIWKNKCEYELKKNPEESEDEEDRISSEANPAAKAETEDNSSKPVTSNTTAPQAVPTPKATNIDIINQHAPLKIKIRDDWYQSNDNVTITIYAKNVKEDRFQIQFQKRSVAVTFPSSASSEYSYNLDPLYSEIDTEQSSYKLYGTKVEIYLVKKTTTKWPTLESTGDDIEITPSTQENEGKNEPLAYPSSSKKAINWANFSVDDDDKDEGENAFFSNLYKNVDDDTRRAMMKSYVQSNGTVLTTDWKEAKGKEYETAPPDGMQAKHW